MPPCLTVRRAYRMSDENPRIVCQLSSLPISEESALISPRKSPGGRETASAADRRHREPAVWRRQILSLLQTRPDGVGLPFTGGLVCIDSLATLSPLSPSRSDSRAHRCSARSG